MMSRCGLIVLAASLYAVRLEAGQHWRKYGVESKVNFVLFQVDGINLKVDAADCGASCTDCSIIKDEGAEADCTNDFVDEGSGYSITLTATELTAARVQVFLQDDATKVYLDTSFVVETYGNASAQHPFDLADAEQDVNVAKISTDQTAADNAELFFDGTGYAGGTAKLDVDIVSWNGNAVFDTSGLPWVDVTFWKGETVADPELSGFPIVDVGGIGNSTASLTDFKDLVDAGYDPATDRLARVALVDTLTTYTGNTPQTDDIGVNGAGLTALPWGPTWDAEVDQALAPLILINTTIATYTSQVDFTLTVGSPNNNTYNGLLIVITNDTDATQRCAGIVSAYTGATRRIQLLADPGLFTFAAGDYAAVITIPTPPIVADAVWNETSSGHTSAGMAGQQLWTDIDAVLASTGTGLTAIPWNPAWDAEVNTEVDVAIADVNLDHLVGTSTGIPAIPAGTFLDQVMDNGTATFDRSTDSLQAIRDRGDAAWTTGGGGSDALTIHSTTITGLTSNVQFALTDGSADAGAYDGMTVVITDQVTATQKAWGVIAAYQQSPTAREVFLEYNPGTFTFANGDLVDVIAVPSPEYDILDATLSLHTADGTVGRAIDDIPQTGIFFVALDSSNSGTVSNLAYLGSPATSPPNIILTAGESDDNTFGLTVAIYVTTESGQWQHDAIRLYRNDVAIMTEVTRDLWTHSNDRVFTYEFNVTDGSADALYDVRTTDGKAQSADFDYTRGLNAPEILTAAWNGTYPTSADTGLQTAVKSGDVVTVAGTVDTHATSIQVTNAGASSTTQNFNDDYSSGAFSISVVIGSRTGSQQFSLRANKDGGAYGSTFTTTDSPAIVLDPNSHSYGSAIAFFEGAGDFALSADAAHNDVTVQRSITNWVSGDYVLWSSSQVSIASPDVYATSKVHTYSSGSYNDSSNNVTITSRRKANGKQSTLNYLVKIANATPILTICANGNCASPITRFVSKTGTDKTYAIQLNCDQELRATPTLTRDAGDAGVVALPALSGTAPDKTWDATLTVKETDPKNFGTDTHTWSGVMATNGAGRITVGITTNPNYAIGGFDERELNLANHQEYAAIGTYATNKANTSLIVCRVDQYGVTLTYVGSVTPTSNGYTIVNSSGTFDADGNYVRVLDSAIYDVGAYDVQILESPDDVSP